MEAKRDSALGLVQHARAALDRPVARESPLVEAQPLRHGIRMRLVELCIARSREALSLLVAEVGFRRLQVRPIGLSLKAVGNHGDQLVIDAVMPGVAQQPLNDPLALLVAALAEMMVS